MALYGYPHVERISTGIHDPLLATAIVLKRPDATVVLAALDLLMIEPGFARQLRQDVAAAIGCAESAVFIGCTHTHSGPVTARMISWQNDTTIPEPDPAYLQFVTRQLTAAAVAADESAIPAELAWTRAEATGVGGNRLNADGITDPECGILAVRGVRDRDMLALALIYGMHPTVLHQDSTLVSADFPHYTRRHLQQRNGGPVPIAYLTGPSGNQSPRRFVNGQTFAEAERLGRKLGAAVCHALDELADDSWQQTAPLASRLAMLELPRNPCRTLAEAECLLADYQTRYDQLQRAHAPHAEVRTAECAVFGAEGTVTLAEAEARGELEARLRDYRPIEVQALRIGAVNLIGLPGECFTEYGLEIKRRASRCTFVATLVNGELQGYIVTPEAAAHGGYEATNAVFAPESGRILVDTAVDLVSTIGAA
jgi:neutral/alkaline ceramidase-like enzyme